MKKLIFVLLILTIVISSTQAIAAPSQWAVAEVQKARENNLVPANLLGDYQKNITREEFSEMAVRLHEALSGEISRNSSENPFTDTSNPEVLKAYELGIVKGFGDGTFRPGKTITREEIAALLFRTLEKTNPEVTQGTYTIGFADRGQISIWFRNEVGFMSKNGIINGIGSNTFAPKLETTREQAIALVVRLFSQYGGEGKLTAEQRSEERRVGKECRSRWSPYHEKKKNKEKEKAAKGTEVDMTAIYVTYSVPTHDEEKLRKQKKSASACHEMNKTRAQQSSRQSA